MKEKEAINHKCPDCGGKLNVIVGVHGREFCRVCKIPVVTNRNDQMFDNQEWEYKGDDPSGNARYGPVGVLVEAVDPRSIGSETEFDAIETTIDGKGVSNKGLIAEDRPRKAFRCNACGRGPCEVNVPGKFRTPLQCLYMAAQETVWIPDRIPDQNQTPMKVAMVWQCGHCGALYGTNSDADECHDGYGEKSWLMSDGTIWDDLCFPEPEEKGVKG